MRGRTEENRLASAYIGTVLFMASWLVLFVALIFAYLMYWARQKVWPPMGAPSLSWILPTAATLALLLGSVFLQKSVSCALQGGLRRARHWMLAGILCGVAFVIMQGLVWQECWQQGLRVTNGYGAFLYGITGFHALHAVAGLVWVLVLLLRRTMSLSSLQSVTVFWHVVGGAWVLGYAALFGLLW